MTDARRNLPQLIAAVGGVVLFLSLFLDWFGGSAWESFSIVDIILAALGLGAAAYAISAIMGTTPARPWLSPRLHVWIGVIAVTIVLTLVLEVDSNFGAFLAIAASLAILAGGILSERPDLAARLESAADGLAANVGSGGAAPAPPGTNTTPSGPATAVQPGAVAASTPAASTPGPAASTPASQPASGQQSPAAAETAGPPAGWYPDPQGQARLRYWDGATWTDQTSV